VAFIQSKQKHLKIVLDTNCFISCIGKKSNYRYVFDGFLKGSYTLCVSNEILFEYEEVFERFWGKEISHNLLGRILTAENTQLHDIYFNFSLIQGDLDDNKFVDTYLSSSADIPVSNDSRVLKISHSKFPTVKVMSLKDFMAHLQSQ
jgi:uncharacterized protein